MTSLPSLAATGLLKIKHTAPQSCLHPEDTRMKLLLDQPQKTSPSDVFVSSTRRVAPAELVAKRDPEFYAQLVPHVKALSLLAKRQFPENDFQVRLVPDEQLYNPKQATPELSAKRLVIDGEMYAHASALQKLYEERHPQKKLHLKILLIEKDINTTRAPTRIPYLDWHTATKYLLSQHH